MLQYPVPKALNHVNQRLARRFVSTQRQKTTIGNDLLTQNVDGRPFYYGCRNVAKFDKNYFHSIKIYLHSIKIYFHSIKIFLFDKNIFSFDKIFLFDKIYISMR